MCGIYGYFRLNEKDVLTEKDYKIIIKWLALNNLSRGKDSTGFASIDKDFSISRIRKTKNAKQFIKHKSVRNWLDLNINRQTLGVLGHTRFATQGEVNIVNSQPFTYDHIAGVHNGHIHNFKEVFIDNKLKPYTTCDSEAIFAGLSIKNSLTEKAEFLGSLYGYLSIAFINQRIKGSIFFARKNNVLSLWRTKDNSMIFWSSEKEVMKRLASQFENGLVPIKIKDNELIEVSKKGIIRVKIKEDILQNWTGFSRSTDKKAYNRHQYKQACDWCQQSKDWVDYTREYDCFLCDDCKRFFGLDYTY